MFLDNKAFEQILRVTNCVTIEIKSICVSWKDKTHLDISEFLLLAPTSNGCGSNKDNKMIKAAVFEFIETSGRKL